MHLNLIDSHCHLDDPAFDDDRDETIERAVRHGVVAQVIPAITARYWTRVQQVAYQQANLFAVYGLHPLFMAQHDPEDLDALAKWLQQTPDAVGIGECGLDHFIDNPDKSGQLMFFEGQLALAKQLALPVVIHARGAVEDVINAIRRSGHNEGMVHSFNGSYEQAKRLIDLGFVMSFGGAVTYDRATRLRKLISTLPLGAILLETDSPDQSDARHKGMRNEPAWLVDVFEVVCALRAESPEEIAAVTSSNAERLFGLRLEH